MRDTQLAIDLIELGARPQVLETETSLSRERLLKLYKEVKGVSPPKGMLPFSTDWFLTWLPNVHSSLFINIHRYITKNSDCEGIEAVLIMCLSVIRFTLPIGNCRRCAPAAWYACLPKTVLRRFACLPLAARPACRFHPTARLKGGRARNRRVELMILSGLPDTIKEIPVRSNSSHP